MSRAADSAPSASVSLDNILAFLPDAALVVDERGVIFRCNRLAEEVFGFEPGTLRGLPVETLVPRRLRAGHDKLRMSYLDSARARSMGAGLDLFGERADGTEFPVDISLAPVETDEGRCIVAIVRDISPRMDQMLAERSLNAELQRQREWSETMSEIQSVLLSGAHTEAVFDTLADRAMILAGADGAVVTVAGLDGTILEIIAASGSLSALKGSSISTSDSVAGRVFLSGRPANVADLSSREAGAAPLVSGMGIGPALVVPMRTISAVAGVLSVVRSSGGEPFDQATATLLETSANQASVVLEIAQARLDKERLDILSDRDRIARDLHDRVIQRIFGTGLGLQAAAGRASDEEVRSRIDHAIDELDATIRELRTSIFELESRPSSAISAQSGLRERVLEASARAAEGMGFVPSVRFSGAVELSIGEQLAHEILAVVREALSNVAKYAQARSAEVSIAVGPGASGVDEVVVTVTDNGRGIGTPKRASGLDNLRARAEVRGGAFHVGNRPGGGTELEWRAPVG